MRTVELHHGVVVRPDLMAAGISPRQIDDWLAAGRLVALSWGTYRVAGAPATFEGRVHAAIRLHDGQTWASHHTAARLWGIPVAARRSDVELTRPLALSAGRSGAVVHRSTRLPAHHLTSKGGIPVTTPARTLFDLARTTPDRAYDRAVEGALRQELCTVGALHRVVAELGGRGRPGTRRARAALEVRGKGYVPTASELEAVGRAVLQDIPGLDWHVVKVDRQGFIGEVDIVMESARTIFELDGRRFHDLGSVTAHDAERDRRLLGLGYVVRRLTWFDLTRRPEVIQAEVLRLALPQAA